MEQRFVKGKKQIERIYGETIGNTLSILDKAGEGFILLPAMEIGGKGNGQPVNAADVKKMYGEIAGYIKSSFMKNRDGLPALFASLLDKQITAFHTGYEEARDNLTTLFPDTPALFDRIQKYRASGQIAIEKTLPDACVASLAIGNVSNKVFMGETIIKEAVEKAFAASREYMAFLFDSAKQGFIAETEKIKAYYMDGLSELQRTARDRFCSVAAIEKEIALLENKMECLDELQDEINKLVTA